MCPSISISLLSLTSSADTNILGRWMGSFFDVFIGVIDDHLEIKRAPSTLKTSRVVLAILVCLCDSQCPLHKRLWHSCDRIFGMWAEMLKDTKIWWVQKSKTEDWKTKFTNNSEQAHTNVIIDTAVISHFTSETSQIRKVLLCFCFVCKNVKLTMQKIFYLLFFFIPNFEQSKVSDD